MHLQPKGSGDGVSDSLGSQQNLLKTSVKFSIELLTLGLVMTPIVR